MRNVKLVLWVIIFAFVGLVIFQNQDFFLSKQSLGINIYFSAYQTPEIYIAVLFLGCFLFGLIVSYLQGLAERFRLSRKIKELSVAKDASLPNAETPEEELPTQKEDTPPQTDATAPEPTETGAKTTVITS